MGTIKALLRGLHSVNLPDINVKSIQTTEEVFIALNKQQLREGKDSDGDEITPGYRSGPYANLKHQMNAKPGLGVPDLFLTGEFYRGFKVQVGFTNIFITSNDDKTPKLTQKYGPYIFGLTPFNRAYYATGAFYGEFQRRFTAVTGLKFR